MPTFMTPEQLAEKIPYSRRHINEYLKDRIFLEGIHYVRLNGSRRIFYIWEQIAEEMMGLIEKAKKEPKAKKADKKDAPKAEKEEPKEEKEAPKKADDKK